MKRTNIYLSEPDQAKLKALAVKLGVSASELIRRAVAVYLKNEGVKTEDKK